MTYSVLMSVYYKETADDLRLSVESMMRQTVPPDDFVLYCDGPLSEELLKEIDFLKNRYPLINVVPCDENKGLGAALGEGLKYCRCELIARMDSDDISKPDRMELTLRAMEENNADIVSGSVSEFDGSIGNITGTRALPETDKQIKKYVRHRNPFNHPCVTFRKKYAMLAGSYQSCPYFEDYWLWARMLQNGCRGYNLQQSILYMRGGAGMYKRRGGITYTKAALSFRRRMRRMRLCTRWDYIITCAAHIISGLMPNKLRMMFYSKILRK